MKELKPSKPLDFSSYCFRFGFSNCMANFDDKGKRIYEYSVHAVKLKRINLALEKYQEYLKSPLPPNSKKCSLCGKESK